MALKAEGFFESTPQTQRMKLAVAASLSIGGSLVCELSRKFALPRGRTCISSRTPPPTPICKFRPSGDDIASTLRRLSLTVQKRLLARDRASSAGKGNGGKKPRARAPQAANGANNDGGRGGGGVTTSLVSMATGETIEVRMCKRGTPDYETAAACRRPLSYEPCRATHKTYTKRSHPVPYNTCCTTCTTVCFFLSRLMWRF